MCQPMSNVIRIRTGLERILRDRYLYLITATALAAFTLAYQVQLPVRLDVGGPLDRSYAVNFQAPEKKDRVIYRPTRANSQLVLPGLGGGAARRVTLTTRSWKPNRPARLGVNVNGEPLGELTTGAEWHTDSFIVGDGAARAGANWMITLSARSAGEKATAASRQDARAAVSTVLIEPVRQVNGRWETVGALDLAQPILPGPAQLAALTVCVLVLYELLSGMEVRRSRAALAALAAIGGLALLLAFGRMHLTVFSLTLTPIVIGSALAAALAGWLVPPLYRMGGVRVTRYALAPVLIVFFFALVLKLGGTFYPQFISSDLLYHQHRWERVLTGNLFFLTSSPEFGNLDIPLAPGYYVFLAPLDTLFHERYLTLKLASVAFDATGLFFIAFLAFRFTSDRLVAWVATLVYTVTPITFLMLSAGNLPNIFSQWLLLALVAVTLGGYGRLHERRVWLVLVFLFVVAGLSHIGNLIVMTTLLAALAVELALRAPGAVDRQQARALIVAVVAGTVLTFLLYYVDFTALLFGEFVGLLEKKFGGGLRVAGTLDFQKVPVAISAAVIAGGIAGVLITYTRLARELIPPLLRRGLIAWLVSAAIFVLIAQFAGIYVRYNVFVLPALALGVGLGCAWLVRRGIWAQLATAGYLGYVVWTGLVYWMSRVMFAYH